MNTAHRSPGPLEWGRPGPLYKSLYRARKEEAVRGGGVLLPAKIGCDLAGKVMVRVVRSPLEVTSSIKH